MTPERLRAAVHEAFAGLTGEDARPLPTGAVSVRRPRRREHGQYTTNAALVLAGELGRPPRQVAVQLAERLRGTDGVAAVDVAGPGFLNVRLLPGALGRVAVEAVAAGPAYGAADAGWPAAATTEPDGRGLATVQAAHARAAALLRYGAALGAASPSDGEADPGLLVHDREVDLLAVLADFPRLVRLRDARRLARHLVECAEAFRRFESSCRVLPSGDEQPDRRHAARLLLVAATRVVLANGLGLLGVPAPERM